MEKYGESFRIHKFLWAPGRQIIVYEFKTINLVFILFRNVRLKCRLLRFFLAIIISFNTPDRFTRACPHTDGISN